MASNTLSNVAVDRVVRHCLSLAVEDESVIHYGLKMAVGRNMGVFYVDDGLIRLWYSEWLQGDINVFIGI